MDLGGGTREELEREGRCGSNIDKSAHVGSSQENK